MASRQLKIKLGICKRLRREVESYEIEVRTNEEKVNKMREEGRDIHDIMKQEEVLAESYMMIPDSKNRYKDAIDDLSSFLHEIENDPEISEMDDFKNAKELLSHAST